MPISWWARLPLGLAAGALAWPGALLEGAGSLVLMVAGILLLVELVK